MADDNVNEDQRSRDPAPAYDFKAKSKKLLDKYQKVVDKLLDTSIELLDSGEDVRSNDNRPGISTLLHSAGVAMNEVQRLSCLVGEDNTEDGYSNDYPGKVVGWNYDPEREAELKALIPSE